jgi:hypothetical protein
MASNIDKDELVPLLLGEKGSKLEELLYYATMKVGEFLPFVSFEKEALVWENFH